MIKKIHARDFSQLSKEERDQFHLIDVRTLNEYNRGHIPKSIHIPHDQIAVRYHELKAMREDKVLLICRSGKRSLYAAKILSQKGFQDVYNLEGGILEWTGEIEKLS